MRDLDRSYVSEEEKGIGIDQFCEERRRAILVDDRLDPSESAIFISHNRYPAAAGTNYAHSIREQTLDHPELDELARHRRGDDASPRLAVASDLPIALTGQLLSPGPVIDLADELRRAGERRITGAHDCLADEGGEASRRDSVSQGLCKPVADHSLGLCPEDVERIATRESLVGVAFDGEQTHLRPVAVRDNESVVSGERCERLDGPQDVVLLNLGVGTLAPLEQCVAAKSGDDSHISPQEWRP